MPNSFIVEGVEDDGSRVELAAFDNSSEARAFLQRYTSTSVTGERALAISSGWDLIEVYDVRGEPERLAFWERNSN